VAFINVVAMASKIICFQDSTIQIQGGFLIQTISLHTQLLDCFGIPVLMALSWFILRARYRLIHFLAVAVCLLGVGTMVGADILAGRQDSEGKESSVAGGRVERRFPWWANLERRKRSKCRGSGYSFILKEKRRRHAAICISCPRR